MALSEFALSELLVALTDRDRGVDLVRELAEYLAQELIEVQATQEIGAGRYECERSREGAFGAHRDPRLMIGVSGRRGEVSGRDWWWRSRVRCVRGVARRGLGC